MRPSDHTEKQPADHVGRPPPLGYRKPETLGTCVWASSRAVGSSTRPPQRTCTTVGDGTDASCALESTVAATTGLKQSFALVCAVPARTDTQHVPIRLDTHNHVWRPFQIASRPSEDFLHSVLRPEGVRLALHLHAPAGRGRQKEVGDTRQPPLPSALRRRRQSSDQCDSTAPPTPTRDSPLTPGTRGVGQTRPQWRYAL